MKQSVLFILHLPNPVHGASIVGKNIKESKLVNSEFSADYINLSTSVKLSEINKAGLSKIYKLVKIQLKVIKSLLNKKYDLYYVTLSASGFGFYKDFLIVILLKLFNKKIIYHFHNKGVSTFKNSFINNLLYKFTFKNTKSILLSKLLYQDVHDYVAITDVYFCANGVLEIKNLKQHENIFLSNVTCKLLFLSNMMAEKGVYILLEALQLLVKRGIDFECNFVGAWSDVSEKDFNSKVNLLSLEGKVLAHGPVFGDDKSSYFNNADVFVFPTYYAKETFGLVNLEAMQYGLPIVSTNEGGIPDVVIDGKTGFIVPQKNYVMLADQLEVLIKDPQLRKEMGTEGLKHYHNCFTLDVFETKLTAILKDAVIHCAA